MHPEKDTAQIPENLFFDFSFGELRELFLFVFLGSILFRTQSIASTSSRLFSVVFIYFVTPHSLRCSSFDRIVNQCTAADRCSFYFVFWLFILYVIILDRYCDRVLLLLSLSLQSNVILLKEVLLV